MEAMEKNGELPNDSKENAFLRKLLIVRVLFFCP